MTVHFISEGKEYISASRASKKIDYTSDYIGQLYRAKRIPGKLIGRTLYIDFNSLLEHKKNRYREKIRKVPVYEFTDRLPEETPFVSQEHKLIISQSAKKPDEIIILDYSKKPLFVYEKDEKPRLPELSKKGRYVERIWTNNFVDQAAAMSLAILIAVSAGFFTLEHTSPRVATDLQQSIKKTQGIGVEFLTTIPNVVLSSASDTFNTSQLAAVSISDSTSKFFESMITGFRNLKEIALNKFFFTTAPLVTVPPTTNNPQPITKSKAVTQVSQPFNLASFKNELKTELESYVRKQISSLQQPLLVYQSAPVSNTTVLREEILLADTRPSITRQSDADADRRSSAITRLADGGTCIRPHTYCTP